MAYTVLARKYRSQTFDDIVGQEPIAQTLKNAIKTGRIAHAFMFSGTRGVGKTTMARILAKSLNCLSFDAPTPQPCCKCESCIAVNAGEDIDVIEIDGASNRGIDNIRELRQNAIYRPARSRFKIYIIDEVHMLTTESFNALLKTLEEPPSHVKFIFATTEPNKVIPTIQSRCQRFDFNNIAPSAIAKQLKFVLKEENIKSQEDLILTVAKMANGSMRDGLSLLDRLISTGIEPLTLELLEQFLGCANSDKIYNLIDKIADNDSAGTLTETENLVNAGQSEVQIVDSLVDCMRDLMVSKSAGTDTEILVLTAEQRKRTAEIAEKFDIAALVYNITTLEKLRWSIKNSDTPRALLEATLLRFALSEHFMNVDMLLSQLDNGQSPALKKNKVVDSRTSTNVPAAKPSHIQTEQPKSDLLGDLQSVQNNWPIVLNAITSEFGNGTAALLTSAAPTKFENGILTIGFPVSAQSAKKMCEATGRAEQIQSLLSKNYGANIKIEFETVADNQPQSRPVPESSETTIQKRKQIMNDPAVKTVLMGLDATVTGIDEDKQ
jgi:DNA polymerase III subunit gamma/tau